MNRLLTCLAVIFLTGQLATAASLLECPSHSSFNGCMTRCPVTCSNLANPPSACISVCTVGCECLEGFVKVHKGPTSPCVKGYECPLYTKQPTLPYPVLRKLAAAASVPSAAASNLTTLPLMMTSGGSGTGTTGRTTHHHHKHHASTAAAMRSSTIAVLRKVKAPTPEENESSHEM